jgi:hypothetical protein
VKVPAPWSTLGAAALLLAIAVGAQAATPPPALKVQASASELAKLKALGLDPNDPNLKAKLTALGKAHILSLHLSTDVSPQFTILGSAHEGQALGPQAILALLKTYHNPAPPPAAAPVINNVIINNSWYGKPVGLNKEPDRPEPTVLGGVADVGSGDGIGVAGTGLVGATVQLTFGNCGSFDVINVNATDDQHLYGKIPKFSIDEPRKSGTMHVHTSHGDASFPVVFLATMVSVTASIKLGQNVNNSDGGHSYAMTPFLGFVEGSSMNTSAGGERASYHPNWLGGSGDTGADSFGTGIKLEHGWTAKASTKMLGGEPSGCDNPGAANDVGGSCTAKIFMQPGQIYPAFETLVAWSYSGGKGLIYELDYKLRGPNGGVPLSSMKQQTDCKPVSF